MADTKISALPASTAPLAGTEVLPIVQSSTTKQVSVANLTAGRTFEALGVTLTSTDAGATASPLLELYRDSATPAASDTLGEIEFNGEDSAGNKQAYGLIHASILSPTSTAEQGQLHFETATAGALTEKMIIGTTNLVINDIGAIYNVRIEGDTDANLFYTDATNSRIGVGTISPAKKLDVVGTVGISSTTTLSGLTASTVLSLNSSKEIVSTATTGTGNVMLASTIRFTDTTGSATPSISGCDPHYPATLQVNNGATPYTITDILGRSTGQVLVVINRGSGAVTLSRSMGEFNLSVNQILANGDCISLLFDDNVWFQIAPVSVNG
jgi:hypothetical protein